MMIKSCESIYRVTSGLFTLQGILMVPPRAADLVIIPSGNGSNRFRTDNDFIATALYNNNIATLRLDLSNSGLLLLDDESSHRCRDVKDSVLLTERLIKVVRALNLDPQFASFHIGLLGIGKDVQFVMNVAAILNDKIASVVLIDGCPGLAKIDYRDVLAPVLLLIGEEQESLNYNQAAFDNLPCIKQKEIIHEDDGRKLTALWKLTDIARLTSRWFLKNSHTLNERRRVPDQVELSS